MRVRIRGIYTTALTRIFLEEGFVIVDPSPEITKRFGLLEEGIPSSFLNIRDMKDKQGIYVEGDDDLIGGVVDVLKKRLFDLIVRRGKGLCEIEFPYLSKRYLDGIRGEVTKTLPNHHRLRIIAGEEVSRREMEGGGGFIEELVYHQYKKGKEITIEHIKVDGRRIILKKGNILDFDLDGKSVRILRRFEPGGMYDGLGERIEEGDFCITIVKEGGFCVSHSYFTKDKRLKGRLYSFNTPVEFYPASIRYVDLELDVVESIDGKRMVDTEGFNRILLEGFVTRRLWDRVNELAKKVIED